MTLNRWLSVAVMALTLSGSFAKAQAPMPPLSRSYPVADLIVCANGPQELIKTITQVIDPWSWQEHGGYCTISYCPQEKALVVLQTSEGHMRLNALLAAFGHFGEKQENTANSACCKSASGCVQPCCATAECVQACCATAACACPQCQKGGSCSCPDCKDCDACKCAKSKAAACACPQCKKGEACSCPNCKGCDSCCCGKSEGCASCAKHQSARPQPKQYGHFVMENVTINAMGVSARIKRIRIMYKGDGIDGDIAKCALTDGASEKKVDNGKLDTLLEKLGELLEKKTPASLVSPCSMPGSGTGAAAGALSGYAVPAPGPAPAACTSSSAPTCSSVPTTSLCTPTTTCVPAPPAAAAVPPKPMPVKCEDEDD